MKNILFTILIFISFTINAQQDIKSYLKEFDFKKTVKKHLKFSTIYGAVNGGTSVSDVKTFSVTTGQLEQDVIKTPYDYSITLFSHPNNTANYNNGTNSGFNTTNLAYNFGDSGSLELKINDTTEATIDLQSNFVKAAKSGSQNISGYTNNGTASFSSGKGRLILAKVAPFNNVSS